MAEIKIEKKKPIWPWILLLLGVLAAIWFFFLRDKEVEVTDDVVETAELIDVKEENGTVASYVAFVTEDPDAMGLDHEFTHEALTKLTNAVDAMANEAGYDVTADIAQAKQFADDIMKEPMADTHSDKIRKAAEVLSASLQNLQQAKYPGLGSDADEVRDAAMEIDPAVLTLDQKDAVKSFFREAAELLEKMN